MWGNPQGNAGEINGISFLLFCFVCLFVYRGIPNKFEAKFVLFDETANKGKMNKKYQRKKFLKKFSARCRRNEEDIIMIRLIEIRTRTLPFLRNKPKAKLKRIKNPKYVAFVVVHDIAFTRYQTLVILHIIDGCQT